MPLLPKFIITTSGYFRMGMVNQHRDLLEGDERCIGGGYYRFDHVSARLMLDRSSWDFGIPKWHYLDRIKVPSYLRGMRIIYQYDDNTPDFVVNDELEVEYY